MKRLSDKDIAKLMLVSFPKTKPSKAYLELARAVERMTMLRCASALLGVPMPRIRPPKGNA